MKAIKFILITLTVYLSFSTIVNGGIVRDKCIETLNENSDLIFNASEYNYMLSECEKRFSKYENSNYKSSTDLEPNWFLRGFFGLMIAIILWAAIMSISGAYKDQKKTKITLIKYLSSLFIIAIVLFFIIPLLANYFFSNGGLLWWFFIVSIMLAFLASLVNIFSESKNMISPDDIEMALFDVNEYFPKYKKDSLKDLAKYFNCHIDKKDTKKSIRKKIYQALSYKMNDGFYGSDIDKAWENFMGEMFDIDDIHKFLVKENKESDFLSRLEEMKESSNHAKRND